MTVFKWTQKKEDAVMLLSQGRTQQETSEAVGVTLRTIQNWESDIEFAKEKDRLSLMVGIASRAERLRIAMKAARQMVSDEKITTNKDLLDWLKFAQSETDGIKLDLTALSEAKASLAD